MPIYKLYSKRQKELRGEMPDIFTYTDFPKGLKVQIVHIIKDAVGEDKSDYGSLKENLYKSVHDILIREYEVFRLNDNSTFEGQVLNFFIKESDDEKCLDVVELMFKVINTYVKTSDYYYGTTTEINPEEAIAELNGRFKEHGFGFQFEANEIIKVDSSYVHSEIVKPTINLIWNNRFSGANEEYLKAHEHYRHGRNKECLTECLKAFESTMKIICKEKEWTYSDKDTSKKLINICFQNELIPSFTQNQFTSLRNLLESGVPTIRNRLGGHGQGQVPKTVDDEMTRYALNLTGSNIIFLIEQSKL